MRTLIVGLLFLSNCGIPLKVSGAADLNVNINLDAITAYFKAYCAELYPYDLTEQEHCVNIEVANFLKMLTEQE